jgi:hypothetical protein
MTEQEKLQQLLEAAQLLTSHLQEKLDALPKPKVKKERPVKPPRVDEHKGLRYKTVDLLKFLWNKYQNQWVYMRAPEFNEALKACKLSTSSSNKHVIVKGLEERQCIQVTRDAGNILLRFCLTKNPN